MTQKTETTWQKPPFRQRFFDPFLVLFWMALIPAYVFGLVFLEAKIFSLGSIIEPFWILILMTPVAIVSWKITFWWTCQKAPRMYPFRFLLIGFKSKKYWNKPPAYFYTKEFQKIFVEKWEKYLEHIEKKQRKFPSVRSSSERSFARLETYSGMEDMNWRANPANPSHPNFY